MSRRPRDDAMNQGEPTDFKDDPLDFALWKAGQAGRAGPWDSPWGPGRPGWHIECSAMAGDTSASRSTSMAADGPGVPPPRERDRQSECATGHAPFARYWVHNGMLQLSGEKMSKSLGNVVGIRAFLDEHEPDALRLFVLSSHYRAPATLSDDSIAAPEKGLDRLRGALRPAQPRPDAEPTCRQRARRRHRAGRLRLPCARWTTTSARPALWRHSSAW